MKRIRLFLLTLVATIAGMSNALADGYAVDFNTAIDTKQHDFIVAKGWGHIVPKSDYDGYGPYYMTYSYYEDQGVGGTGTLCAARQYAGDYSGGETVYDLLVTPKVNGTVTLDVKASISAGSSNNAFVEVYAINADGTRGSLLKTIKTEIAGYNTGSNTKWATFTLAELTEGQKLGLRLQYVYVDNFTASGVDIPKERTLQVTNVANLEGKTGTDGTTTYFEQQADGTLKVQLKVTLTNTGDFDFAPGDEGYSLTLARASYASGTKTYYGDASVNITEPLAAGESKAIDVDFAVPFTTGWAYWFVRENIGGTTSSSSRYAGVKAYESKFVFREAGSTNNSSLTADNWGTITERTTKKYEIANTGTAPLTVKAITLPEGFTVDNAEIPAEGLQVAAGGTLALNITNEAVATGTYAGTLAISYLPALAETATTFTMELSATVISANTWTANFNNTSSTIVYPAGAIAEGGINSDYQYIASNNYNNWIKGRTTSSYASENNKFITPKLHAAAGDKLTFDVKGVSGANYYAKVYVSADRKTWGEPVATYTYAAAEGSEAIGSGTWQTKSISFDTAGDYYVAFALYGEFCIDNLIGLEKVDVAHDLFIKSVNWPDATVKSGTALTRPSIDIIPLTTEAADAYTVKYIYGDNEVAIASKALTASASSTTSFNASFTPTVETTTTFPATKVVFTFTDGTTFETEPFDLTVTNEPVFHFLNAKPVSKWYEPSDRTAPITFGRTNEAATQSFIIFNWGSAPLTVNAITLPEGFTTTTTFPMTVAAFNGENDGIDAACQTLDITFLAEAPGDYSGNMVITYSGDKTFTLPISGTMLDPAKWYATFGSESNQWPAGSIYQKSVSTTYVGTGDYAITCSGSADNLFITPKLTATAGEKLAFNAKLYSSSWNEGKVVVYAAATREELVDFDPDNDTRTPLFSVSGLDETTPMTTDYQTFEVPAVAGDNYYAFEISGRPYVDELYGLTLTDVAHDWTLVSSSIPSEAMQNVASTARVSIANFGITDEAADSYNATLYIDGEAAATAQGIALPMAHQLSDAGKQLTIAFRSPKVGTFPAYVEVKAGDYSVRTETVDVTFMEEQMKSDATAEADGTSSMAPLNLSYLNSESVSLYTSDVLANSYGLAGGAKIKSITYKGYKTTEPTTSTLNIWYEWTDDATQAMPADGLYNTNGMTQVVTNKEMTWEMKGSQTELEDFIVLNFAEPLVFEQGKSLRIVVRSNSEGWKQTFFEKSKAADLTYYHYNDTKSTFETNSWTSTTLPLLHFGLEATATTFSGTVKNTSGETIEGAVVTLVSSDGDNVQYTGTTDAAGAYSISVIQAGRQYDVTVGAEGYVNTTEKGLSFAEGDVVKNYVLDVPMAEGTYYVYNPQTEKFLSRGATWGTHAVVDDYGVAIKVAVADLPKGEYTLTSFDNGCSYGDDSMYADKSGTAVRHFTFTKVDDGITMTNATTNVNVSINADFIVDYTDAEVAPAVWQLLTKEQRDQLVNSRETAAKAAAFASAGLTESDELDVAMPTVLTFTTGHSWTQTVVRSQSNQPATNENGTEMWQATGYYTQTVANVPSGLYKVTIQAFYRNGNADECIARYSTSYNTVLAFLEANGNKVQVQSWVTDKGNGSDPNTMASAKTKFDAGKYVSEVYTYVGDDGKLNLTVSNPSHIGNGWFIASNVKYALVTKSTPTGIDAISREHGDDAIHGLHDINVIRAQYGDNVRIYTPDGKEVRTSDGTLRKGLYIIRSSEQCSQGHNGQKIMVK